MTDYVMIRAVLDTNVIIAALKSKNPRSPTAELMQHWRAGAFKLLYSDDVLAEYIEKCAAKMVSPALRSVLLRDIFWASLSLLPWLIAKYALSAIQMMNSYLPVPSPARPRIWSHMIHTCLIWGRK